MVMNISNLVHSLIWLAGVYMLASLLSSLWYYRSEFWLDLTFCSEFGLSSFCFSHGNETPCHPTNSSACWPCLWLINSWMQRLLKHLKLTNLLKFYTLILDPCVKNWRELLVRVLEFDADSCLAQNRTNVVCLTCSNAWQHYAFLKGKMQSDAG